MADPIPFWRRKTLAQMSREEWESLCDGCGKCCLHKLEDEDTGEVYYTTVACRLLDTVSCRCRQYDQRHRIVPECVELTPDSIPAWMPSTCAYRRVYEGKDLPAWHPLLTGDVASTHAAGLSVRGHALSESDVFMKDLNLHVFEKLDE